MFLKPRFEVWRDIWSEVSHGKEARIVSAVYAVCLAAYGILRAFVPSVAERLLKTPALAALLSFRSWVILALVIIILLTLEGAYRAATKREDAHKEVVNRFTEEAQRQQIAKEIRAREFVIERLKELIRERREHDKYIDVLGMLKTLDMLKQEAEYILRAQTFLERYVEAEHLTPYRKDPKFFTLNELGFVLENVLQKLIAEEIAVKTQSPARRAILDAEIALAPKRNQETDL